MDRVYQFWLHLAIEDWMAYVITKIKWANEETVYPGNFGNGINLSRLSAIWTRTVSPASYICQGFLGLDLHNGEE